MLKIGRIVMFALLFGGLALPLWAEEDKAPKTVIEESEFDFQAVEEGKVLEHTFKVRNEGEAPLNILDVKTG